MKGVFIEASQAGPDEPGHLANWGKFYVARFDDEEWSTPSALAPEAAGFHGEEPSLLAACGWGHHHLWVMDIQTGEGAFFSPGGSPSADLNKHRVWVCPMFEPFLTWLYTQDLSDLDALPRRVTLPDAEFSMAGYRRPGEVRMIVKETLNEIETRIGSRAPFFDEP